MHTMHDAIAALYIYMMFNQKWSKMKLKINIVLQYDKPFCVLSNITRVYKGIQTNNGKTTKYKLKLKCEMKFDAGVSSLKPKFKVEV